MWGMWRGSSLSMAGGVVMAKILVCAGVRGWSMERVIRGIMGHTKHDIEIAFYWIEGYDPKDWDGIYIHSGAVMNGDCKSYVEEHRNDTKWMIGIRGPTAFKRNIHRLTPKLWDGFSAGCHWYKEEVLKRQSEVPGYVCHGGIDVSLFNPTPFPEEFKIGWVGAPASGTKRFQNFIGLPFDKVITARGKAYVKKKYGIDVRGRKYSEMPEFYSQCSIYVNTSYREGGPLPPKEAGASGRPSVITRTGDGVEWVPEEYIVGVEKYSFERDKMIDIIERFKNDKDLLIEEGKRFRELAKRWDFSIIVEEYDKMFDEVLE